MLFCSCLLLELPPDFTPHLWRVAIAFLLQSWRMQRGVPRYSMSGFGDSMNSMDSMSDCLEQSPEHFGTELTYFQ